MTRIPDFTTLYTDDFFLEESEASALVLYVSGYIVGVTAEVIRPANVTDEYITGQVWQHSYRDADQDKQVGEFRIPYGWGYHKGGLLLPRPAPNMNSACPYILKLTQHPKMRITQISCWDKEAERNTHGTTAQRLPGDRMPEPPAIRHDTGSQAAIAGP